MYNVKIYCSEKEEFEIYSKMPLIPKIGEAIGFWVNSKWVVAKVISIVYEFNDINEFEIIEITVFY